MRKGILLAVALLLFLSVTPLILGGCGGKKYKLTIAVVGQGTTSPGAGTHKYDKNEMVTITAAPASGWAFDSWSGAVSGTTAAVTVIITSDTSVIASFSQIPACTLTVTKTGSGRTTPPVGRHGYDEGREVYITATPATGWRFDGWSSDAGMLADVDGGTTAITMDDDYFITANFSKIPTYTLTIAKTGNGSTTPVVGHHKYYEGTVVKINATPRTGWRFGGWSGEAGTLADVDETTATITMDDDYFVTANFVEIPTYALTIAKVGKGTTRPGVDTRTYREGQSVIVTATPANGWKFDNWSGDASDTTATIRVTMDGDKTVIANFVEIPTYTLTMAKVGNGTTRPAVGTRGYDEGTVVTITATPASGCKFDSWTGDVADPASATTTVTMDADKIVTANFAALVTYTLTMAVNPEGGGTTTPAAGTYTKDGGQVVNITATPASGYKFDNWTGDVANATSATTKVTMDADKTVTANFSALVTYTLTMAVNPAGGGTTTPAAGVYTKNGGQVVNITATPAGGYKFDNWTGDVANATSATTTVTMSADKTVTANFSEIPTYTLTMAVSGNGTITPAVGDHTYLEGTVVNITATQASGWHFDSWTGDVATVADVDDATTTITMDGDYSITATFLEEVTYILTMDVDGNGSTSPMVGDHEYDEVTVVKITATPRYGWKFDSWTGDIYTVDDPDAASTTITVDGDYYIIAVFVELDEYILTMDYFGEGSVKPTWGEHTYLEGTVVDITATPDSGWQFVEWLGDVDTVADVTDPTTTVTLDADCYLIANFVEIE